MSAEYLAYLRQLAAEGQTCAVPRVIIPPVVLLSLLDQIDEWEATDKANADERKQLLDRIKELERQCVDLKQAAGAFHAWWLYMLEDNDPVLMENTETIALNAWLSGWQHNIGPLERERASLD